MSGEIVWVEFFWFCSLIVCWSFLIELLLIFCFWLFKKWCWVCLCVEVIIKILIGVFGRMVVLMLWLFIMILFFWVIWCCNFIIWFCMVGMVVIVEMCWVIFVDWIVWVILCLLMKIFCGLLGVKVIVIWLVSLFIKLFWFKLIFCFKVVRVIDWYIVLVL